MLQYYYHHLVAIFTLSSCYSCNCFGFNHESVSTPRLCISGCAHSDTVWSETRKQVRDLTEWHFHDHMTKSTNIIKLNDIWLKQSRCRFHKNSIKGPKKLFFFKSLIKNPNLNWNKQHKCLLQQPGCELHIVLTFLWEGK